MSEDRLMSAAALERSLRLRHGTVREGVAMGLWSATVPPGHKKPRYSEREVRRGLGLDDGR